MKWCRSCERALWVDAFAVHRGGPDGRQSYCRECGHDRYRVGRESKGALVRPEVVPEGHKFCRSCQTVKPLSDWADDAVHVDHDHATGAVRGMLCFRCNAALGQFDEDAETLVRETRYLLAAAHQRIPADVLFLDALVAIDRHGPASSRTAGQ